MCREGNFRVSRGKRAQHAAPPLAKTIRVVGNHQVSLQHAVVEEDHVASPSLVPAKMSLSSDVHLDYGQNLWAHTRCIFAPQYRSSTEVQSSGTDQVLHSGAKVHAWALHYLAWCVAPWPNDLHDRTACSDIGSNKQRNSSFPCASHAANVASYAMHVGSNSCSAIPARISTDSSHCCILEHDVIAIE